MACCGNKNKTVTTASADDGAAGKSSQVKAENPIADLECGKLVLLSDGQRNQHGYLMAGQFHDIHGRVIPEFTPTHFFF